MAIIFALIAILAVVGGLAVSLSRPNTGDQQKADQHEPRNDYSTTNPGANQNAQQDRGSRTQEQEPQNYRERFVALVERYEKVITAGSTFVIAAFTAALVFATIALFISSERVAAVGRDSADAARRAADTAERALIAGQRAFISASFVPIANLNPETGEITNWGFRTIWTNSGDTPTRLLINHINLQPRDDELPPDWDFPDYWPAEMPPSKRSAIFLSAPPHGTVNGHDVYTSMQVIEQVIAKKKFLYLWGWATYSDVFPNTKKHVTRFAVQVVIGGNPRDREHVSFQFPYIAQHNCSDEECDRQRRPADWTPREVVAE
ncbi:MAG: hypothetical protein HYR63_11985 [Proteobacteria bacterium]|nr:hypothetical protein [Pseudomonadota bacterium]MBI3498518.1 hypothetical protein [Pseudomonadota bacterium]